MKSILDFQDKKNKKQKISMITCYDYSFAQIVAESNIDCILIGDSLANTMHGFPTTLPATVEMMALHTAAVARGAGTKKFITADFPFMSNRKGLTAVMNAAEKIMQAGAHALKLEGGDEYTYKIVRHLVDSGVPIMGHLGLTPQSVNQLGGFKVQGRDDKAQAKIREQALRLQEAGAFCIVLECVPSKLAAEITHSLDVPTIGIGAGSDTDGQVLVLQDLLGMNPGFKPKFVKTYFNGFEALKEAFNTYHSEVEGVDFPSEKESYS
ncbi:3-methyl-2-oxobutanoate hydroxymethyltransferase [Bdellovibrio sp. SKB1291214]|uniref:3-methyl-2-oxobutanoate hydroxymethyltransferase n=1 Tax=Bdellovibrio sp. SKB1291214 TaxID=1732569 RepID=UPI000B51629A|nr:3-methyl-2-oxobutanoate hydroxymethyltransferase [Bdellovibrio sp. SKB1291214]UYL08631.1 3-methyl-2-oxobutanoate hydroxymethyltransferase [Bdellovibrio sp. SKB1291214]